jgi:hypothetical protein
LEKEILPSELRMTLIGAVLPPPQAEKLNKAAQKVIIAKILVLIFIGLPLVPSQETDAGELPFDSSYVVRKRSFLMAGANLVFALSPRGDWQCQRRRQRPHDNRP